MKTAISFVIVMFMSVSLIGATPFTSFEGDNSSLLLNQYFTSRDFGMNTQKQHSSTMAKGNYLKDFGIGFVVASTTSVSTHKNNYFYKKSVETGNPYRDNYMIVSNWLHFEVTTPIINIMYENSLPIWSTFGSTPRFSKTHFDFLGFSGEDVASTTIALMAPSATHSIMSTRDYTKSEWDFQVLFMLNYRSTTETFLFDNSNPFRLKSRRFYYFAMSSYLGLMQNFSRYLQVKTVLTGEEYEGIGLEVFPVIPFFDVYNATVIREDLIDGQWQEVSKEKDVFNWEVGVIFVNEYHIPNRNIIIQPYFKWLLYSTRNISNDVGTYDSDVLRESGIEASLSIQYVF